tara:strand:+ start:615 stop:1931 length:1317 start_codon:yes stop_codon:yes gene_type:complete
MFLIKLFEKKYFSYLIIILLLIFSFYRSPHLFLEGRFWGEDGSYFFQNAINNDFFENFFKIYEPTAGYYNLFPRLAALIANSFPIEFAPLVSVYLSYIIIFYIFLLTIFSNSFLVENKKQKFLLCFLILFCSSFVPEVWVNTVNAQIYFGVLSILILYSKNNSSVIFKIVNNVTLFIGGFSTSYVVVLFPFFIIKYYLCKTKNFLINSLVVTFSFLFQLFFYLNTKKSLNMIDVNRDNAFLNKLSFEMIDFYYLQVLIYNVFLKTLFSKPIILQLKRFVDYFFINKLFLIGCIIISLFFILIFIYLIIQNLKKSREKIIILYSLWAIFITILTMNILVSGSFIFGRYASILGFTFALTFLYLSFQNYKNFFLKKLINVFLILIYLTGIYQFRPNNYQIYFLDCLDNCKPWKEQIMSNTDYIILWPYNTGYDWRLMLNK